MDQKYLVRRGDGVVIDHLEGKKCRRCESLVSFKHQGPCPNCGGNVFEETVIPNLSDLETAKRAPPEKQIPMGGTD